MKLNCMKLPQIAPNCPKLLQIPNFSIFSNLSWFFNFLSSQLNEEKFTLFQIARNYMKLLDIAKNASNCFKLAIVDFPSIQQNQHIYCFKLFQIARNWPNLPKFFHCQLLTKETICCSRFLPIIAAIAIAFLFSQRFSFSFVFSLNYSCTGPPRRQFFQQKPELFSILWRKCSFSIWTPGWGENHESSPRRQPMARRACWSPHANQLRPPFFVPRHRSEEASDRMCPDNSVNHVMSRPPRVYVLSYATRPIPTAGAMTTLQAIFSNVSRPQLLDALSDVSRHVTTTSSCCALKCVKTDIYFRRLNYVKTTNNVTISNNVQEPILKHLRATKGCTRSC